MTDENEPTNGEETPAPSPESGAADQGAEKPDHSLKEGFREGVGKVVGFAVEVGSLLGGESGDIVEAEKALAGEATEDLVDRIDGEG